MGMAYTCQLSFALVFQSIPPVLRLIVAELGISHAHAGLLMSLFAFPGVLLAIPTGLIADRYGAKKVGVASLSLMMLGTSLLGLSDSFALMALARVVTGTGAVMLTVILPQLISRWFMHKELGTGMGIFNTAMPLGTVTSLNILGNIGAALGWRVSIFLTTAACAGGLLTFLLLFRKPEPRSRGTEISTTSVGTLKAGKLMWLVGLTWLCFNASFISFLTFAPDLFAIKGYEVASASFLTSVAMMGSLFLSPFIGHLVNRFGKEEWSIFFGGLSLAFLMFSFSILSSPILLIVLIGLLAAFVPAPSFSLPSRIVDSRVLGQSFGIMTTCSNAGVLVGPYLAGLAKDMAGHYTYSLYIMSLFSILQAVVILILRFSLPTARAFPRATKDEGTPSVTTHNN